MSIFENDFLMREIKDMTKLLGNVFLHRKESEEIEEQDLQDEEYRKLLRQLKKKLEEQQYREAVAELKDAFQQGSMEYLTIALYCFDAINAHEENELAKAGYSRNPPRLLFFIGYCFAISTRTSFPLIRFKDFKATSPLPCKISTYE